MMGRNWNRLRGVVRSALTAWRRERAERALARLDMRRTMNWAQYVIRLGEETAWEPESQYEQRAHAELPIVRRAFNAAKRQRRAIRSAGGKAGV